MKRILLLCMVLLTLFSSPAAAQHNPMSLDDECFELYNKAERLVGGDNDEFERANESLRSLALTKKDTKAETIYYVLKLKHFCRRRGQTVFSDVVIKNAFDELKEVSRRYGYTQYYYYAYELLQNYLHNNGRREEALDYVREMQDKAVEYNEDYGIWMSARYMINLYKVQNDIRTTKYYTLKALDTYNTTTDSLIRRQSPCRLYTDLSDCYPVGSDSMRLNIYKAVENATVHLDSLRCAYYLSILSALDHDRKEYALYRDYCLADPQISSMHSDARQVFRCLDAILDGSISRQPELLDSLSRFRSYKFVANTLERYGEDKLAFAMEKQIVDLLESRISSNSANSLSEVDSRLDNRILAADRDRKARDVIRSRNQVTWLMGILAAAAVLFSLYIFFSFRQKRREDLRHIQDLTEANEKVRLADAAKTRFVQNMSHEVRTPLNAIVGFSQLLALPDGSFPPEEKDEFSGHIINNTQMLTMLLDDILNASAMDSGKYRISLDDGELHFMCKAAISSSEHRLQPGVTMVYEPESDQPFHFRTDPRRVQQIIINLLTNACKHTKEGRIVLASSLTRKDGYVSFIVTDTGPGIPAEQAEKIFDRFTKLNDFVQGTGLGLSICRDIASRMGSKVYLDTTWTGGGARFVFEVPVNPPLDIINDNNNTQ